MSAGTFALGDQFKLRKKERHTHWGELYQKGLGRYGIMDTASLDNRVTDSAAASSAWGGGHRVKRLSVNVGPNGETYKPILAVARDAGKATGIVTTTTVTHATPAGFGANLERRGQQRGAMEQYLDRNYDLLLGGGHGLSRRVETDHRLILRSRRVGMNSSRIATVYPLHFISIYKMLF